MEAILSNLVHEFQHEKDLADRAITQLNDDEFFRKPAEQANSVAIIVKHLAGNLRSRWSDFLTTDGNKPDRDRDNEFVIFDSDTHLALLAKWETAWSILFATLDSLDGSDLTQVVTIRGETHTVMQAVLRGLTHTAYHTGQIVYLTRLLCPESPWLTIEPGKSLQHTANYLGR